MALLPFLSINVWSHTLAQKSAPRRSRQRPQGPPAMAGPKGRHAAPKGGRQPPKGAALACAGPAGPARAGVGWRPHPVNLVRCCPLSYSHRRAAGPALSTGRGGGVAPPPHYYPVLASRRLLSSDASEFVGTTNSIFSSCAAALNLKNIFI